MRPTVQILSGIWLQADRRDARARGDRHGAVAALLAGRGDREPGTVVLPGRLLVDIAELLPAAEVEIAHSPEEGRVSVVSGSASYSLHTYAAEDFPRLPEVDAAQTFSVAREALLETITRVGRSASRDESRPVLTGILVRFGEGKLVMAATDSYRLAVKETAIDGLGARARGDRARARADGAGPHCGRRATRSTSACTRTTWSSAPATCC